MNKSVTFSFEASPLDEHWSRETFIVIKKIIIWVSCVTVSSFVGAQEIDWDKVARGCRVASILADGYAEHRMSGGALEEVLDTIDRSPENADTKNLARALAQLAFRTAPEKLNNFGNDYYEFCMNENNISERRR